VKIKIRANKNVQRRKAASNGEGRNFAPFSRQAQVPKAGGRGVKPYVVAGSPLMPAAVKERH
jgi:hypothetical protein